MHDINRTTNSNRKAPRKGQTQQKQNGGPASKTSQRDGYAPPTFGLDTNQTTVMTRCLGVPRRMNTTFRMALAGYLPAASTASGQATINANSFFEPFASTNPLTTGWSSMSLTNGSSTVAPFPGTAFYSNGFKQYRVKSSKLTITAVSGAGGDTMNVWMVPLPQTNTVATNFMQAKGQPGFRGEMITAGCRPIKIVSVGAPWQVLGLKSLDEYEKAGGTIGSIGAVPGSTSAMSVWQVSYATMDGSAVVGQVYFDFEVEMNVDFFNPTEELV